MTRVAAFPLAAARVRRAVRARPVHVSDRTRRGVDAVAFLAIVVLLLVFFRPGLLLSSTTTTGGDMGAHIYTPWYLKHHLLPSGLTSGWSQGWYAGFPILHFYFPFVVGVQALLAYVIPYEIAFKLGTVLGTFSFPLSVYLLFRLLRFRFPTPIVGALLSLGFLFMDSFTIYGGNIPSTLAGEYSFSFSLGMHLVFLGLAYRVATSDDGRPLLAAGVLAVATLSHLVPVMMVVLSTPLLAVWAVRTHGTRGALVRLGVVFGGAFALTAFWSVPFLVRLAYSADMHWFPLEGWAPLFPRELWLPLGGALLAVVVGALRGDGRVLLFAVPAAAGFAMYFAVAPDRLFDGTVWNGRFLPFWYLGTFLATAYVVGTTLPTLARLCWRRRTGLMTVAMVGLVGVASIGQVLRDKGPSFIDDWIEDNYEGYEAKEAFPTFQALMATIAELPPGRVMWEPSPDLVEFGTPIALMTIPYWTGHPTMEGIYFESSMTTPYHFVTASEVAERPSNPIPKLPYHDFDLERGLQHLQLLDVSYFLTVSEQARQAASTTPGLTLLADVDRYSVYAVESSGQVVVPRYDPVVVTDADWTAANLDWFATPGELDVPMVRNGPDAWDRIASFQAPLPRRPVDGGGRSVPVEVTDDEIRFTTEDVGKPHWVKTSYFPNWKVDGALGPYLASPSMMMVVPTQSEVRLHYQRTWPEWTGLALTLAALAGLAVPRSRRWARRAVTPC